MIVGLLLDAPLFYFAIYSVFSGEYIIPMIVLVLSLLSLYKGSWLYVRTLVLSIAFIILFFLKYSQTIGYLFPLLSAASNLLQLIIKNRNLPDIKLEGKEKAGQRKHFVLFSVVAVVGVMVITTLLFYEFSVLTLILSCATVAVIVGLMNVYVTSNLISSVWSFHTVKQLMAGYYIPYMKGGRKHPARLIDESLKDLEETRAKLLLKMQTALSAKNAISVLIVLILVVALYGVFKLLEVRFEEYNRMIFEKLESIFEFLNSAGGELF
ncbi:hypothetical protein AT15_08995 [Kosmotoga arenicorallina S304]|uniref:Uncharacterized protein n=1 Tax=Kosmotoga arenicorallina S304 TaxID=1453497 RepID=A0A176K1S3_9BACT|nr:hypothetical protein [Kosmotoga arenicorallina]OAA31102.1 hypothetical protein AT15_08995 [Kosmotoga arenicorallina S304]